MDKIKSWAILFFLVSDNIILIEKSYILHVQYLFNFCMFKFS